MLVATDNLALVKGILNRMLASGDIQPLLDGLADDVMFTVASPHGSPDPYQRTGKAAVLDYFVALGDLRRASPSSPAVSRPTASSPCSLTSATG